MKVQEFLDKFVDAIVAVWLHRFKISMNYHPTITTEVLNQVSDYLKKKRLLDLEIPDENPMDMGIKVAELPSAVFRLASDGAVTPDKITKSTLEGIKVLLIAAVHAKRKTKALDDIFDEVLDNLRE